jgi:hypothetical protein
VPVTFFAHQVPVLPIARRWPARTDGLALVIGSMAPDFAYLLAGSRFRIWAHSLPALVLFCVPVTIAVCWLVARVLAPVVPDHLPSRPPFHLDECRGLATWRLRLVTTPLFAAVGALSHVALDHFTHDWGWFARNVDWYRRVLIDDVAGRDWTVFKFVQYAGHIGGTLLCLWLLSRYGRARWLRVAAAQVVRFDVTSRSRFVLVAATTAGMAIGLVWALLDRSGSAVDTIRIAATTFSALTAASAALLMRRAPVAAR